jgi:EAL domain-containing protein (putative c-di-GMP-specific phosphodiesterase class I)
MGGITSVFQPIAELDTGRTVAYEALARGAASQ